jgi:hypothetical protein
VEAEKAMLDISNGRLEKKREQKKVAVEERGLTEGGGK